MNACAAPSVSFENITAPGATLHRRPKRRAALSVFEVLILAALVALLLAGVTLTGHPAGYQVRSTSVRVESGQTLWDLAESHPVAGMSTDQTAELIARLNNVGSRGLVAHTVVRVPAATPSESLASR